MKKQYREIFNHRGEAYHQAMKLCPDARNREFTIPLELLDLQAGNILCDFPQAVGISIVFFPTRLSR